MSITPQKSNYSKCRLPPKKLNYSRVELLQEVKLLQIWLFQKVELLQKVEKRQKKDVSRRTTRERGHLPNLKRGISHSERDDHWDKSYESKKKKAGQVEAASGRER